ncbi:hypothetical protein [Escherichia phage PJNS034]
MATDKIVIRMPKDDIECERKYPFTYFMNAALRGMQRRYSEQASAKFGSEVEILFPTALSKMIHDHMVTLYQQEGFELAEEDFEDSEQYRKYLKLIKG